MLATATPRNLTRLAIFALPDHLLASHTARLLRLRGWEVRCATVANAAETAHRLAPATLVLSADGDGESGWLTCAKLTFTQPAARVILVGEPTPINERLARFVGADALVSPETSPETLAAALR